MRLRNDAIKTIMAIESLPTYSVIESGIAGKQIFQEEDAHGMESQTTHVRIPGYWVGNIWNKIRGACPEHAAQLQQFFEE